jgi:hypothetical protein|tara:strand:+ start:500 stop:838 length:339 start_codon:yes stop_codon:yes gene_type:complete
MLRRAGIPITGVSCPTEDVGTWSVEFLDDATGDQQATAATLIAGFDADVERETVEAEQHLAAVTKALDEDRLVSAVIWTLIDHYDTPVTADKYTTLRAEIIEAYQTPPWTDS